MFQVSNIIPNTNRWHTAQYNRIFTLLTSSYFLLFIILTLMLAGGVASGELLGGKLGNLGTYMVTAVIGLAAMAIVLILRQDDVAIVMVLAVRLYVDWYLGLKLVAQGMAILLLIVFYLSSSPKRAWRKPHTLWLWLLLLVIALYPASHGLDFNDELYYYSNVILSAFLMFWLGQIMARDVASIKRLLNVIALFASLIAVHSLIQYTTGKMLFSTSEYDAYLSSISNYEIFSGSSVFRTGSFFVNPDSAGGFFSMMLLIPLGLFANSSSFLKKGCYLIEIGLILLAVMFTYSTESWLAVSAGMFVFLLLVGKTYYRLLLILLVTSVGVVMPVLFPTQLALQLQHISSPNELLLRTGAWRTGLQVIQNFPLSGLGLGRYVYVLRADPYRVVQQFRPLDHPHNSFLELAALGGIPFALTFIALLLLSFWRSLRTWIQADPQTRSLLAGCIASAAALTSYSMSDAGWTLAPLLAAGWLFLGIASVPLKNSESVKIES